jgi:prevent-host-death family protein
MTEVSIRELRNQGGQVLDRVARGERITITRDGKPVAELRPYARTHVSGRTLLERWRRLPPIDPATFRADVDQIIDSRLE